MKIGKMHVKNITTSGKNGIIEFNNKFCIMYGYVATSSASAIEYIVNFPKTFINTNYHFERSAEWIDVPQNTAYYNNGYTSKTTTSVNFYMNENTYQAGCDWLAFGFIE